MSRTAILTVITTGFVFSMGCSTSERLGAVQMDDGQIRLTTLGPSVGLASPRFEPPPYRLAAGDTLGAAIFADYIAHIRAVIAKRQQSTPTTLTEAVALAGVPTDQES